MFIFMLVLFALSSLITGAICWLGIAGYWLERGLDIYVFYRFALPGIIVMIISGIGMVICIS